MTLTITIHWQIAFYGRVSTSIQEDQETIENQIMAIKEFTGKKFGTGNYTIVREYVTMAGAVIIL